MSALTEYHDSTTSELYESAPTPTDLSLEDYEALEKEWGAMEERYKEAVTRHDEWKAMKAREAKEVWLLKMETLKKEKLEAERKEQLWLEAEEKEKELALEREKQEAMECQ